jgi:BspA type Leucine rich repeat region (6 copies)
MRNLILSALLLASAFQTALGEQAGDWIYTVSNNQATIITYTGAGGAVMIPSEVNGIPVVKAGNNESSQPIFGWSNYSVTRITIPNCITSISQYAFYGCNALNNVTIGNSVTSIGYGAFQSCTGLTSITIPNSVTSIGYSAFSGCTGLTSITIPNSVTSIGDYAFSGCAGLTSITIPNSVTSVGQSAFLGCTSLNSVTMPDRYIAQIAQIGISGQVATDYLVNALANSDAFVTAVANKIKATSGNYGLSVKSELETLATKSELTSAITESRTAGVNSVLSNPNLWTLYTTSQIQNMAMGDLVLTKQVNGKFALNYDIEQSEDLKTWTTYRALYLPLNGLPTDKAFVRIKMINSSSNPSAATPVGSNMY